MPSSRLVSNYGDDAMQDNYLGISIVLHSETDPEFRYIVTHVDPNGPSADQLQVADELLEVSSFSAFLSLR